MLGGFADSGRDSGRDFGRTPVRETRAARRQVVSPAGAGIGPAGGR
jgi:hypothetical protein